MRRFRRFRERLAHLIAPWLFPRPHRVIYRMSDGYVSTVPNGASGAGIGITWTGPTP